MKKKIMNIKERKREEIGYCKTPVNILEAYVDLEERIKISDLFLNDGEIVSTRGRKNSDSRKFFAKQKKKIHRYGKILYSDE